ncbi:MAG TPA: glutaminyl-peptide cyclotransferase [Patescibacteria group bacterium]|nr:glutaminyl-peptide cyclotransferase [Patescibacteria group bacterium]
MKRTALCILLFSFAVIMFYACNDDTDRATPPDDNDTTTVDTIPIYHYRIINTYPHDPYAYTQGLAWYGDTLYEGTGLNRFSTLRKVDLETGDVLQVRHLGNEYFGEGIVVFGDTIIQLTWTNNVAFVYDRESFTQLGTFGYPTQGWGITYDGHHLIMSDGTAHLSFRDPHTFVEKWQVYVHDDEGPVTNLNELEYINGTIYANKYLTQLIVMIDPGTGEVTGWIDCSDIREVGGITGPVDVMNGIAYDVDGGRLFVTGKKWPKLFEIELVGQ